VYFNPGTRKIADKLTFGVLHASRMTKGEALLLAPCIVDGNNVRGTAVHVRDALRESIATAEKHLADIQGRWDADNLRPRLRRP
jgi:hypothetical protein